MHDCTALHKEDGEGSKKVPRLTRSSAGSVLLLAVLGCDGAASAALVRRTALSVLRALAESSDVFL